MKAKKVTISVVLVLFIVFAAVSTLLYNQFSAVNITGYEGSYAQTYAQENNIPFEAISDSEAYTAVLNLEDFSYNEDGTVTSYHGPSKVIAIPSEINGIPMTRVASTAFKNAKYLKEIYIPKTIVEFNARHLEGVTVHMYKHTDLYRDFINDKDFKPTIHLIPDSYVINYQSADIPFAYNKISSQTVEITHYTGTEKAVTIPESINGKTVTTLSLNALDKGIDTLVIPATVTNITTPLYTSRYDLTFLIGMIIGLVGAIAAVVFVLTLKVDTNEKLFLTIPQIRAAYITAVLSNILALVYLFLAIVPDAVVYALLVVVYGLVIWSVIKSKTAAETVAAIDGKVKAKTFFIKSLTIDAEQVMKTAQSDELKTIAKKVYEAVRYSDPMSSAMLVEVEEKIQSGFVDLEAAVRGEDAELAASVAEELLALIDTRNKKCKLLK